ncbi:hypothetical protein BP5796_13143 [Coleophoma crateriformis]|uniref:Uncharacterized protein n=1 Tax=Coleophoma crateriformis TaxID=565419 RepID=A0A3D8Q3T1_9HELO|nr:hypothetical protein BP5796_13143 [Coleophoma crateriformis]
MNAKHEFSAVQQDGDDETATAVALRDLQDASVSRPTPRAPRTKAQWAWQFLHPAAWILLLCIGGPILLHELSLHYLDSVAPVKSSDTALELYGTVATSACAPTSIWTSWSALFEINIRTGKLSFTSAKIIDVCFDLVVGRGGQAGLAYLAYRVYSDVLVRITETGQVAYDLFAAIALCPHDLLTIGTGVASLSATKTFRLRLLLIWTLLAMAYVVAFPTLISTATSLVGATTTAIQLPNNATAPIDAYVRSASYSLADTGLANKPNPWIVPVADINAVGDNMCNILLLGSHPFTFVDGHAIVVNHTTYAVSNNTQTTCGFDYGGTFYPAHVSTQKTATFVDKYFIDQIVCMPDGHNYQWGASWELLFLILILQCVWSLGVLLVWIEVTRGSQLVQRGRGMGMWRTILDLSEPLRMRLGPGIGMYSQDDLVRAVRDLPPVHYEIKVEGMQDGGYLQDVHLVSGSDTAVTSTL